MDDAAFLEVAKALNNLGDDSFEFRHLRKAGHLRCLHLLVQVVSVEELEHKAHVLPEFELVEQGHNVIRVLGLYRVRLLEQPHFTHTVFDAGIAQILTDLNSDSSPLLMVLAEEDLTESAAAELLQRLIPEV